VVFLVCPEAFVANAVAKAAIAIKIKNCLFISSPSFFIERNFSSLLISATVFETTGQIN
jgi:hypothetical protein